MNLLAARSRRFRHAARGGTLAASLLLLPGLALAQASPAPAVSQAVVQPLPGARGQGLNAALARVARNPRDAEALIDAGKAALDMGDVDAAIGFYTRADQVAPGTPRAKAGLAGALVRRENPFDAIPLFAEAERGGLSETEFAADRGLAYDLVGDNATAQTHYRNALARGSDDDVLRRLAISFAIAGDKRAAEETLAPMLARQDKAAFRTRAFALAILGQPEDGVGIAYASLPAELAAAISPYLRYMPRLTPAQQAAAANFGHFPRASEIGRDDPRIAQYATTRPRRPGLASADAALVPKGEPLGRNARRGASRPARVARAEPALPRAPRAAPPEVNPVRQVSEAPPASSVEPASRPARGRQAAVQRPAPAPAAPPPATVGVKVAEAPPMELPPRPAQTEAGRPEPSPPAVAAIAPAASTPAAPAPVLSAPAAPAAASPPPPAAERPQLPAGASGPATPAPGFDLAGLAGSTAPATPAPVSPAPASAVPAGEPAAPAVPERPRSLAEAFSDLARPVVDTAPAAGAVDIRRITPPRDVAPAARTDDPKKPAAETALGRDAKPREARPARPAPPSHPSRIWVQVATGRDKAALAFDWRRMTRQAADVFRGKSAHVSAWGQTNRLLTGPFQSQGAANAFIAQLNKADIEGSFVWTSPAGQVVDALPGR